MYSVKKTLIKNSISGIVQLITTTFLVFFTVSIFVKNLGSEYYGLFATISLIGNLNIFTNLGINSTLLIFISENGKSKISDHNIIVAAIILILIAIPASAIMLIFDKFFIFEVLNIPLKYYQDVYVLYIFLVISNFLIIVGQLFNAILDSMQKIFVSNILQLIYNVIYNSLIIVTVLLYNSLSYVGVSIFTASIIWFASVSYVAYLYWGKLDFRGLKLSFLSILKSQLSLGFKIYVSGMIFFFYEPLTKILISHFLGIKEVGFFDIALKIRNQLWGLINKALQPLLPLISQKKDDKSLHDIINDFEIKTFYLVIPIIASSVFSTKYLINVWIGGEYADIISITTFYIMISYLAFSATLIPQYYYLMSKGHAEKTIYIQLTNAIINFLIIIIFFKFWGYYTFIVSYVSAIMFSFALMLYYQKKLLNSIIFDSFNQILKMITTFIIIVFFSFILDMLRIQVIYKLMLNPILTIIMSVIIYRYLKIISINDISRYIGEKTFIAKFVERLFVK